MVNTVPLPPDDRGLLDRLPLIIAAKGTVATFDRIHLALLDLGSLPKNISRVKRRDLALARMRERVNRWGGAKIPAFGRPLGVRVWHGPDDHVAYDMIGNEVTSLEGGYGGEVSLDL